SSPPPEKGPDLGPAGVPELSAGNGQTCGIHGSGSLYCWGRNAESAPAGSYRRVALGAEHACAIRAEAPRKGEVDCWGSNDKGQAKPPAGIFIELAAGYQHTCGLRPDGRAVCWGNGNDGRGSPPDARFVKLSAGKAHGCGLTREDEIKCWGAND